MTHFSLKPDFNLAALQDLLAPSTSYISFSSRKPDVIATAVGLYRIRKAEL